MQRFTGSPVAVVVLLAGIFLLVPASPAAAQCEPDGEVQFLCGPVSPEDLAPVPDTPWVIVSSMIDGGSIYAADTRDHSSTVIYPVETSEPRQDTVTYGACPGPVSRDFRPHGLYLRPGEEGRHTLLVVGHGAREAIEVFEVDADGRRRAGPDLGGLRGGVGAALPQLRGLPAGRGHRGHQPADRRHLGMGGRHGLDARPGQREHRAERPRDLPGRRVVLRRRLRPPGADPPVARTDPGRAAPHRRRLLRRQRALGPGQHAARGRSHRTDARGDRRLHPGGGVRGRDLAGGAGSIWTASAPRRSSATPRTIC